MRGLAIEFPTEHIASSATRQSFTGPLWSPSTSLIAGAHVWPLNNPKIPPGKRSSLSRSTSILRSVLGIWSFDVGLLDCSIKPPKFFQTTVVLHASTRFYDRLNNVMKDITDVCRVEMSVKWTKKKSLSTLQPRLFQLLLSLKIPLLRALKTISVTSLVTVKVLFTKMPSAHSVFSCCAHGPLCLKSLAFQCDCKTKKSAR